jgi:hypothetical protein
MFVIFVGVKMWIYFDFSELMFKNMAKKEKYIEESDFLQDLKFRKEEEKANRKANSVISKDYWKDKGIFNGIGVDAGMGSLAQDFEYEPTALDFDIPKRVEAVDVFEVASDVEGKVIEGKYGMNIAGSDGVRYKTAGEVMRSWYISTDGIPEEMISVKAHEFLLSMSRRFMERYEAMLTCLTSIRGYADFKGVSYGSVANKVFLRDGAGLDVVVIGGTKFIKIPVDEFYEWHKHLAEKGAKEYADHEEKEKAKYLANVYVDLGGEVKVSDEMLMNDSVKEFIGVFKNGIQAEGGGREKPKGKGYHFDTMRGSISMAYFYEQYYRWALDLKKILPVKKIVFNRRVYAMGFTKYNNKGVRGIHYFRKDGLPADVMKSDVKIPRRGRYKKPVEDWSDSYSKFIELGGDIK